MKFTKLHMFAILLAVLLVVCWFNDKKEGMSVPDDLANDDRYILKSKIVPPVCPACPSVTQCPKQKPCRPCPPCARCPEPDFTCKKVPKYSNMNRKGMPVPILADFSQFGS